MSSSGVILVTGATGNVGGAVVSNLRAGGANVRALVRDASKAQGLKSAGVDVVEGDLDRHETLDAAFKEVDKVFLLTPVSPDAATQSSNAIAAAKRAGPTSSGCPPSRLRTIAQLALAGSMPRPRMS